MSEYAKKVDANHALIREYIRDRLHYCWCDTSRNAFGFPDAVVIARNGIPVMLEIKSHGGWMEPREKKYQQEVREAGCPFYFVVFSPEDAEHALAYAEAFELVEKKPRSE
ncbi:MAG: hypothetical protein PHV98_00855 [Candidatus Omnitrophica bacterium]|nr:hypothetical protein [Candidatus Omnitrophota bacterium]